MPGVLGGAHSGSTPGNHGPWSPHPHRDPLDQGTGTRSVVGVLAVHLCEVHVEPDAQSMSERGCVDQDRLIHRIGGMGGQAHPKGVGGGCPGEDVLDLARHFLPPSVHRHADDLEVGHAGDARVGQCRHRGRIGDDVGVSGDPRPQTLLDSGSGGGRPVFVPAGLVLLDETLRPIDVARVAFGSHFGERRVLEVGMGVDQARRDHAVPLPHLGLSVAIGQGLQIADLLDLAFGDRQGTVDYRRSTDRDDHVGCVQFGHHQVVADLTWSSLG